MTNEGQDTERPGALIAEEPNGQVRPGGDVKPPPHPLDKWWFLHVDGSSYGPYTGHQLKEFVGEGRVTPESVVAREGAQDWVKASEDQTLAPLFRKAPLEAQLSAGNGATVVQVNRSFGGGYDLADETGPKNPGIALLLSLLLCGVGQMYNGQIAKGILMLIGCLLLWIVFLGWVIWIWSMIDAYQQAKAINRRYQRAASHRRA